MKNRFRLIPMFPRCILAFWLVFQCSLSYSQMGMPFVKCYPANWTFYYFAFHAKYQISSETLVAQANQQITNNTNNNTNGFVTVRFVVNCKEERGDYEVLQINQDYQETKFDTTTIDKTLAFVKTLNHWKRGMLKPGIKVYDYNSFISFKFDNGKITEIIP